MDRQQDLVRVQKMATLNSINIQANSSATAAAPHHLLVEDESPMASPTMAATAPLKGSDGYDRLIEHRCGRYLYHHGQATFLPVPAMPDTFVTTLHTVAGSRNIKGEARDQRRLSSEAEPDS
jgi:hypothetical protein